MEELKTFKALLLIARPAAGKSEIIDFLKHLPIQERILDYHIGEFHVIDDFPMLWAWFEEDAILSHMGKERLHTDKAGNFKDNYLWDVLIERIDLEYQKFKRDALSLGSNQSAVIEFSRGSEHGGYQRAFEHLSDELLQDAAILYIDVPWEESLRKNRKRFNPEKPDSILEHGLTDEKLEQLYKEVDWEKLVDPDRDMLRIKGHPVPYIIFNNHDDVTTARGKELASRLKDCLDRLWTHYV